MSYTEITPFYPKRGRGGLSNIIEGQSSYLKSQERFTANFRVYLWDKYNQGIELIIIIVVQKLH